ncbi:MAG: N-acetyltransferase [Flavobacteriales bacterium]|nr:N-acetyltransferase [Flavobacteriales bacterium]
MVILEVETGRKHEVVIGPVESKDFRKLTKKRYFFNWKEEKDQELYKLRRVDDSEILGLVSFERIPSEWRIHIRLLTVSFENKGTEKQYEGVVGNLITYVAREALKDFGEMGCVSLIPKSKLAHHYMDKYGMRQTGVTLSVELPEILELLTRYDHEK